MWEKDGLPKAGGGETAHYMKENRLICSLKHVQRRNPVPK